MGAVDDHTLKQAWQNRQRRWPFRTIGELAGRVVPERHRSARQEANAVEQIWQRVLPEALIGRAALAGVQNGRLCVIAGDVGSKFELERVVGPAFLEAVRKDCPACGVTQVHVVLQRPSETGEGDTVWE
jgi:hypothetical protein